MRLATGMLVGVTLLGVAHSGGVSRAAAQAPAKGGVDVITVVGCVERETDYRTRIADGKGGPLGSGVGTANEFVLTGVRSVSAETNKPVKTSGGYRNEVLSVTGKVEHELTGAVGHQVAMSGFVETDESAGTSKVKDLPRLNAAGWHMVSNRCPAKAGK